MAQTKKPKKKRSRSKFKVGTAYCFYWDEIGKFNRCWLVISFIGDRYIAMEFCKPNACDPHLKEEFQFDGMTCFDRGEFGGHTQREFYKQLPNKMRDEIIGDFVDVKSIIKMYKLSGHLFDEESFYA